MVSFRFFLSLLMIGLAVLCPGCRPTPPVAEGVITPHLHHSPHGGTAVELGKEEYHLELVHETGSPQMTAYILDGELEKFIRLPLAEFIIRVKGQNSEMLRFQASGNPATGEKVGDTSEYIASSSWLTNHAEFDGVLVEIKIGTKTYQEVAFSYPKGNE